MIRRLEHADLANFRTMRLASLQLHPEAFSSSYEEESQYTLDEFARFIAPPGAAFGAFVGDRLVGMARLYVSPRIKQIHKGDVVGVYVDAAYRGSDIAHRLLEAIIATAREAKLRSLRLSVTVGNDAARRLYLALGFQPYGIERRALLVNGVLHDDELMMLDLD